MSNENNDGTQPSNPSKEQPAKAGTPQTPEGTESQNQAKKELESLKQKLERYKQQVSGSSEEARRLKEERDDLKEQVENLQEQIQSFGTPAEGSTSDQVVNGLRKQVDGLTQKVEHMLEAKATEIVDRFKKAHPGLIGEVESKFDGMLKKIRPVFDVLEDAMDKAYVLVGGLEADNKARSNQTPEQIEEQSRLEAERIANEGSQSPGGDRTPTIDHGSELKKKLNDLETKIYLASLRGATDPKMLVEKRRLEFELKKLNG